MLTLRTGCQPNGRAAPTSGANAPGEVSRLAGCLGAGIDVDPLLQFRKRQAHRLQASLFVQISGTWPLARIFQLSGTRPALTRVFIQMFVVQLVVSVL